MLSQIALIGRKNSVPLLRNLTLRSSVRFGVAEFAIALSPTTMQQYALTGSEFIYLRYLFAAIVAPALES